MATATFKIGATSNSEAAYIKFVENILIKLMENAALLPSVDQEGDALEQVMKAFKWAQTNAPYRDKSLVVIKNQVYAAL